MSWVRRVLHHSFRSVDTRVRILAWATLIGIVAGLIGLGEPVDDMAGVARNAVRMHDATGDIVVIAKDDRSAAALGRWPLPRIYDAKAIDTLFALGARRVMFDRVFADETNAADDRAFADALKRHPGRVSIGVRFDVDHATGKRVPLYPIGKFRRLAQLSSINVWLNWMSVTARVPFDSDIGGTLYPSFASRLARVDRRSTETFKPDFSIYYRSIPTVSFVDVIRRTGNAKIVAGRDVIIGATSDSLGDKHHIPTQGIVPGVHVQVIAAETLRKHIPVEFGWLPAFAFAFAAAWLHLFGKRRRVVVGAATAGYLFLVLVPVIFDGLSVSLDIAPALFLLSIVTYRAAVARRHARSTRTNAVSQLPDLNALRGQDAPHDRPLVCLKIRNYAEIRASFTQDMEQSIVSEIVGRVGVGARPDAIYHGDDAVMWFSGLPLGQQLTDHLEGLHALFSNPLKIADRSIDLSIGFGIDADYERPIASRIGSVIVCADEAAASGMKWKLYDAHRLDDVDWRLSLLGQLDRAIGSGEIWVAYQPQLDLARNSVNSAEALVRWSHPERGELSPADFVIAAEQSNRIERLTSFVLETAIADAARVNREGKPFGVSVNLSARLLDDEDLAGRVEMLLRKHGLAPGRLTMEITESGELDAGTRPVATMHALRGIGVNVSIDDYGTGFSTLDYVRIIPANEIKIDKHFVDRIDVDDRDRIMVSSTIQLAHSLGRKVVAEGVENEDVLSQLSALGCDVAQGFLIGKPMPVEELRGLLGVERKQRAA